MNMLKSFIKDEDGATAIEYGLIAALISVGILVVLGEVGSELEGTFNDVKDSLSQR